MFGELVTAYLFLAGVGAGGVAAASLADLLLVREPFGTDVVPDFAEKRPAERLVADRKSTRLNSSHWNKSRMPSSA